MIAQTKVRLYTACLGCTKGSFRVDHLKQDQPVWWSCDECGSEISIVRINHTDVAVNLTGKKKTPITVTLRSQTEPPIEVKVNTWKYVHSQNDTPEDFESHERFFYEEHTCPTNWFPEVEQISVGEDHDPHGLFEFISVEDGHFKDPSVLEP